MDEAAARSANAMVKAAASATRISRVTRALGMESSYGTLLFCDSIFCHILKK